MSTKRRFIPNINIAFLVMPLVLLPLLGEWIVLHTAQSLFSQYREIFFVLDILYIVIARLALLDSALYVFSHSPHPTNATLIRIVMLYLEITVITIAYFAIMFYMFDVFSLFHLSAVFPPENFKSIHDHSFVTAFYISTVTFTTLGSGDWIPQTLNAMIAVSAEVILGVIQGGVFVAIIIYAHQNRPNPIHKEAL
jgi:hypothetical protein